MIAFLLAYFYRDMPSTGWLLFTAFVCAGLFLELCELIIRHRNSRISYHRRTKYISKGSIRQLRKVGLIVSAKWVLSLINLSCSKQSLIQLFTNPSELVRSECETLHCYSQGRFQTMVERNHDLSSSILKRNLSLLLIYP